VTVGLRVIYDSQGTNRKLGGLPARTPFPGTLLLVVWESYMTPNWPEYTKTPPQTSGCSYLLIEKSPKTKFLYIKPLTR
jgi:hypothetical protein